MRSKAGRLVEGLHVVGGVTAVSKISICMCLISIKMHVCDALQYYHVFRCNYELLLIPLFLYVSSNSVITLYCLVKCVNLI